MLSSEKGEKGIYHSEFLLCFLQKKECMSLNLFFVLFRKKAKGMCISEFCFSFATERKKEICQTEFNFSFPGRSKYDEIS